MESVGPYEIVREIGRGGMAVVYLARQPALSRDVALKRLDVRGDDGTFARRFMRESQLAGSLSHPNIVTVHDFFEHDGQPYIAMEYCERGSLRPWLGRLSLAQYAGVFEGLFAGLEHAGAHDIVHRDLKPENILVTRDGHIAITDFGIAKACGEAASSLQTATGMTVGTPAYMAPEQALGERVGPQTDLYAAGVMAFELASGRVPFADAGTAIAILYHKVNEDPPIADAGLDPALTAWIVRLLARDPASRPADAREAWEQLEEHVIDQLGPRWRRDARLSGSEAAATDRPLTPATFLSGYVTVAPDEPSREASWSAAPPELGEPPTAPRRETPPPTAPRRETPAPEALAPVPPAPERRRRVRVWAAAGGVLAVAVVAVVAVALSSSGGSPKSSGGSTAAAVPAAGSCALFPADFSTNQRVDSLPVARDSAQIIRSIGADTGLHPDFGAGTDNGKPLGIPYNVVSNATPRSQVRFGTDADESDHVGYPIPAGVKTEAAPDAHALLLDEDACRLYELYQLKRVGSQWTADAGATWDLRSDKLRPAGWTSADGAGLPILPLLAREDEVAKGKITHALRVTVPRTRADYLYPARHKTGDSTDPALPRMGERLRLKRSIDISRYPPQARTILEALKHYGLIVADNGAPWFITGTPDPKWDDDQLATLKHITGSDFEVVDASTLSAQ